MVLISVVVVVMLISILMLISVVVMCVIQGFYAVFIFMCRFSSHVTVNWIVQST